MEESTVSLGGPGPRCSTMRLRRLAAGELSEADASALLDHLQGCSRCQRSQQALADERGELARELPFPRFAAAIAERLAAPEARRPLRAYLVPMALAATLAAVVVPLALHQRVEEGGNRTKGSAGVSLLVKDASGIHELLPGQPVASGAHLGLSLRAAGHPYAAAALVEAGQGSPVVSPIFAGPVSADMARSAFEWTGTGHALLVVWFSDKPIEEQRFVSALQRGASEANVTAVSLPLLR